MRAGRVIQTLGRPAKFYGMTSIYLTSPDGRMKWWTMDPELTETNLINQANSDRLFGVQNAPSTESPSRPPYDSLATAYDQLHPAYDKMTTTLRDAVPH
jgi:hypothetical protein